MRACTERIRMRQGSCTENATNSPDPLEWNAMDYPNLLETAFDEFSAAPAAGNGAGAGNDVAACESAGAPQLLIWRQIRWSNRRPLIEVEPVVPGGVAEGAHNRASQAAGVPYMTGESAPSQESSPAQRGVPSGVRIQIPLTPGAYMGLRIPRDSEGGTLPLLRRIHHRHEQ